MGLHEIFGKKPAVQHARQHVPVATTTNVSGGRAYNLSAFHALCQVAFTGCFNSVITLTDRAQLETILEKAKEVTDDQLAALAVTSRKVGYMKAMPPAFLWTLEGRLVNSGKSHEIVRRTFKKIMTGDKIFKDGFEMAMSGKFGFKTLTYAAKRCYIDALYNATPEWMLTLSIGGPQMLRRIFKLTHPKPRTPHERALWGYVLGNDEARWGEGVSPRNLPDVIKAYNTWNAATTEHEQLQLLPMLKKVRWELLSGHIMGERVWRGLADIMGAQALRMNLNTLTRQGAFKSTDVVDMVAARLADVTEVQRAKQFPYQYLQAYKHLDDAVPSQIRSALHKATEAACGNIPQFPGPVVIAVDISGSMTSNVMGQKENATVYNRHTTQQRNPVRCVDVAALAGVAMWRKNPGSLLVPFDTQVHGHNLDPNDSILSLTERLKKNGGGTNCSIAIEFVNQMRRNEAYCGVVLISDNESWADSYRGRGTGTQHAFADFQANQRRLGRYMNPKMVCIDLVPGTNAQVAETADTMCIGGFSDVVFELTDMWFNNDMMRFTRAVEEAGKLLLSER